MSNGGSNVGKTNKGTIRGQYDVKRGEGIANLLSSEQEQWVVVMWVGMVEWWVRLQVVLWVI